MDLGKRCREDAVAAEGPQVPGDAVVEGEIARPLPRTIAVGTAPVRPISGLAVASTRNTTPVLVMTLR
jgi:hypothetical protein